MLKSKIIFVITQLYNVHAHKSITSFQIPRAIFEIKSLKHV
jgi:hypothetical protein